MILGSRPWEEWFLWQLRNDVKDWGVLLIVKFVVVVSSRCAQPCQMWPDSAPCAGWGSSAEAERGAMDLLNCPPDLLTCCHSHQGPQPPMLQPTAPQHQEILTTAQSAAPAPAPGTARSHRSTCSWRWYAAACLWCWAPSSWPSTSRSSPPPPPSTTSRPSPPTSLPSRYDSTISSILYQKWGYSVYRLFWRGNPQQCRWIEGTFLHISDQSVPSSLPAPSPLLCQSFPEQNISFPIFFDGINLPSFFFWIPTINALHLT